MKRYFSEFCKLRLFYGECVLKLSLLQFYSNISCWFFLNCISRKCILLNASEDKIFKNKQFFKSMDHIYK